MARALVSPETRETLVFYDIDPEGNPVIPGWDSDFFWFDYDEWKETSLQFQVAKLREREREEQAWVERARKKKLREQERREQEQEFVEPARAKQRRESHDQFWRRRQQDGADRVAERLQVLAKIIPRDAEIDGMSSADIIAYNDLCLRYAESLR